MTRLSTVALDEIGWRRVGHALGLEVPRSSGLKFRTEEGDWPVDDGGWPQGGRAEAAVKAAIRRAVALHVVTWAEALGRTRELEEAVNRELVRHLRGAWAHVAELEHLSEAELGAVRRFARCTRGTARLVTYSGERSWEDKVLVQRVASTETGDYRWSELRPHAFAPGAFEWGCVGVGAHALAVALIVDVLGPDAALDESRVRRLGRLIEETPRRPLPPAPGVAISGEGPPSKYGWTVQWTMTREDLLALLGRPA